MGNLVKFEFWTKMATKCKPQGPGCNKFEIWTKVAKLAKPQGPKWQFTLITILKPKVGAFSLNDPSFIFTSTQMSPSTLYNVSGTFFCVHTRSFPLHVSLFNFISIIFIIYQGHTLLFLAVKQHKIFFLSLNIKGFLYSFHFEFSKEGNGEKERDKQRKGVLICRYRRRKTYNGRCPYVVFCFSLRTFLFDSMLVTIRM
ncbi:hypothetical protein Hanom_Chr00s000003g01601261 [Helianthus anomalus]